MKEYKLVNDTDEYYTYEGSTIINGHLINVFIDDYGQSYVIQYEEKGELKEIGCGSYNSWESTAEYLFESK